MPPFQRRFVQWISSFLIGSLLTSCTASSHLGTTTIERPSSDETREQAWFSYYQDQFDGTGGNVAAPGENDPAAAHRAYQKALDEWNLKTEDARNRNQAIAIFLVGAIIAGIVLTDWTSPGDGFSMSWR